MARTKTTERQALWQPGGAEEDSRFREGNRRLRVAYEEEEKEEVWFGFHGVPVTCRVCFRDRSVQTVSHAATLRRKLGPE